MNVLGISAFYHDSAACLVTDGRIVAAAQEERFTKIRHDNAFPWMAIQSCLEIGGVTAQQIDRVVFYEKPLIKLERILQNAVDLAPSGLIAFATGMPSWFADKLRLQRILKREIGYRGQLEFESHHQSHAASAFFPSPFEEAAIITVDGVGEWATNAIATGRGNSIEIIHEINYPDSLGLLYSALTEFLGFKVNSDEYKVMGLAPYGEPRFATLMLDRLVDVADDGSYRLNMEYLAFRSGRRTAGKRMAELFGCPPRAPESAIGPVHMDIARSIQEITDLVMTRQAAFARRVTGMNRLCLAGGVALNCVANGHILRSGIFDDVWIQPAAGDAGGALGAALSCWYRNAGATRRPEHRDSMAGALLGPEFTDDEILTALTDAGLPTVRHGDAVFAETARHISEGQVVARFSGRMEFGPRALGSRSILADPRNRDMQRIVNEKIKFREGFRPFAPAVLEERCGEWFDLARPSPYMLLVAPVAESRMIQPTGPEPSGLDRLKVEKSLIPAVTHVDGSARVQTVTSAAAPDLAAILRGFDRLTGCPVLLNTSFNLRGQPIVRTPAEAVETFLACDIDALSAGPFIATKPAGWTRKALSKPRPFRRPRRVAELRRFGFEISATAVVAGFAGWFLPAEPAVWTSTALWAVAALLSTLALAAPHLFKRIESAMHVAGAKLNGKVGAVLFGIVHVLVVTPTGIITRLTGRRRRQPPGWASPDPSESRGGPQNMY